MGWIRQCWGEILKWGEFIKFSHTLFALPFALAAMLVAARETRGWPGIRVFALILLAMVCARTCAMAFNRIMDRDVDRENPRTASRHLPAGKIRLASAWTLCLLSGAGFLTASAMLNWLCFLFSPFVLFLICFYSVTKRFTHYTHIWLGVALGLAPLGAWLAVRGEFTWWPLRESIFLPLIMALGVVFWLIGFDIIYALQDYEFDRQRGLKSLVVAWGPKNALQAAFISHLLTWGFLALFGFLSGFRVAYFLGMFIILLSLLLEHWLARKRQMKWIQIAFFRLNSLISTVFFAVVLIEVVFPGFRLHQ